jgi:Josephin
MSHNLDTYIFHEVQESMLCGQHALNNLLQESIFTPIDLAEIAQGLDAQERAFMMVEGNMTPDAMKFLSERSGNVDESGNFSIQVLRAALQQSHAIELISWTADRGKQSAEMTAERGFIVNRSAHWFTIRKIKNRWWNLNSTLERPEAITEFYLTAFLSQLIGDGYTVFQAKGNVPVAGVKPFGSSSTASTKWYSEKDLVSKSGPAAEAGTSFPGEGRRLTERKRSTSAADIEDPDFLYNQAIRASASDSQYQNQIEDDDDPELAMAIALSRSENSSVSESIPVVSAVFDNPKGLTGEALAKELMKQKRLEALNRRGL